MNQAQSLKVFAGLVAGWIAIWLGAAPLCSQETAKERALPPGAVARLENAGFWHGAAIRALAFTPDETLVASLGADQRLCIWEVANGRLRSQWNCNLQQNDSDPHTMSTAAPGPTLVFSGDGKTLALADAATRRCRLWDVAAGKELPGIALSVAEEDVEPPAGLVLPAGKALGKRANVGVFGLAHDAKLFAVAQAKNHAIHVVTPDQKEPLHKLSGHSARVLAVVFSNDGARLASAGDDQTIRLWDLRQGKLIRTFAGHRAAVQELAFAPDGKRLVSGSLDGSLRLWDVESGQALAKALWKPAHLQDGAGDVALTAARSAASNLHRVWFEPDGQRCGAFYSIAFGTTGFGEDAVVRLDATTGNVLSRQIVHDHRSATTAITASALLATRTVGARSTLVALAPRQNLLARATTSAHVQLLAIETGLARGAGVAAGCADVEMAGDHVAIVRQGDPAIYLWNWKTNQPLRKLDGHTGQPFLVGFSPRGQNLVSASRDPADRSLSLWDVAGGAELRQFAGWDAGAAPTSASAFAIRQATSVSVPMPRQSPDGRRLAFRGADGRLRVVDVQTGADVASYPFTWKGDGCVAFSADGRHVILSHAYDNRRAQGFAVKGKAMRDANCYLQLIEVATGKEVGKIAEHSHDFHIMRLAIGSRQAIVGCKDGAIRGIDLANGKIVRDIWVPQGGAKAAPIGKQPALATAVNAARAPFFVASADGRMIAVRGPNDAGIKIIEVAAGKERLTLPIAPATVTSMGFAEDGLHLVTGSQDGAVVVWALGAQGALSEAQGAATWQALAGDDAAAAFTSLRQLLAAPAAAVALVTAKLQPAAAPDESIVAKKIRDLDSPVFTTRQKAQDELTRLGDVVRGHLEKAGAGNASAELTQRVDAILKRLNADAPSGDRLREMRAVELLERLGTKEAIAVLQRVAAGASGASLTLQARDAVERLRR